MNAWRLTLFSLALMAVCLQATMGYVVTPILFSELDSKTAGDIAATLFSIFSYFGMAVAIVSLVILSRCKLTATPLPKWPMLLVLLLTAISHFVLGGWMGQIKAYYPQGLNSQSVDWALFMQIHGVYQLLYVIVLLVFLGWLWRLLKFDK